jgi:integrase
MVKRAFAKAHADNIIIENPFLINKELKQPKSKVPKKKVEAFSVDDQKKLVEELMKSNITQKVPILLSLYTCMRSGEILALSKDDIDLKEKKIKVRRTLTRDSNGKAKIGNFTKTYAGEREITINADIETLLDMAIENYIENPEQLLFCREDGTPYTTQALNSCFKRFCEAHNIDKGHNVNFHQLRHTGITRLIELGTPVEIVQKKAGHTDISTTMNIYNTVLSEREKEVDKNIEKQFDEKGLSLSNFTKKD